MRGSLLINFLDFNYQLADDGYPFRFEVYVNNVLRDLSYSKSNNYYTTNLLLNDECTIRITKNSAYDISNDIIRKDYTTDEENGDRGIKEIYITGVTGDSTQNIIDLTFTANTTNDAYDFYYISNIELESSCYDIGSGYTWTGSTLTPRIFDIKLFNNQVYAAGIYNVYNGVSISGLTVTNLSGLLNNSFPNTIRPNWPGFIEFYNNGKFLLTPSLPASINLRRYNSDGSIDNSFSGLTTSTSQLNDGKILSDNKIIIVGLIASINGNNFNNIAKLNEDGSVDTSWPSSGFTINGAGGIVYRLSIQDDNKILCIGVFNQYSGISTNNICRLNSDGTFDNTFTSPFNFINPSAVLWGSGNIKQLSNGKILVGGYFNYLGQIYTLLRLNSDGSVDSTFNKLTLSDTNNVGLIYFDLYNNGKILYNYGYATKRLDANGNLDNSFNTISTNYVSGSTAYYNRILYINESNEKIFMGGRFSLVNNVPYNRFVVSDLDGNLKMC
jgi:uncharacterized delta-60 repeat protein